MVRISTAYIITFLLVTAGLLTLQHNTFAQSDEQSGSNCVEIVNVETISNEIQPNRPFTCEVIINNDEYPDAYGSQTIRCGLQFGNSQEVQFEYCPVDGTAAVGWETEGNIIRATFSCIIPEDAYPNDTDTVTLTAGDTTTNCENTFLSKEYNLGDAVIAPTENPEQQEEEQQNSTSSNTDKDLSESDDTMTAIEKLFKSIFDEEEYEGDTSSSGSGGKSGESERDYDLPDENLEDYDDAAIVVQLYNEIKKHCNVNGIPGKVTNDDVDCLNNIQLPVDKDVLQGTIDTLQDDANPEYTPGLIPVASPRLECVTFAKASCFLLSGGDQECLGGYGNAQEWAYSHPSRYTFHAVPAKAEPGDLVVWQTMHIAVVIRTINNDTFEIAEGNFDGDGLVNMRYVSYGEGSLHGFLKD